MCSEVEPSLTEADIGYASGREKRDRRKPASLLPGGSQNERFGRLGARTQTVASRWAAVNASSNAWVIPRIVLPVKYATTTHALRQL